MKAEQLVFQLPSLASAGREDFLVAPSNQSAVLLLDAWPEWHNSIAVIHGPPASGKSHLLKVWADKSNALCLSAEDMTDETLMSLQENMPPAIAIDDSDEILNVSSSARESFLFHIINMVKDHGRYLMMTTRSAPSDWNINLSDLASRLKAAHIVEIHTPDETLLMGLLVKLLNDRQLSVDPDVVPYVVTRLNRSFESILSAVEKIDAASLKEKRRITLPFVKKTLSL